MNKFKLYGLSILLIFGAAPLSIAQTTWDDGGADDNWFTALNWDGDVVPNGTTADVIVGAPAPVVLNGNININSLMVTDDGVLNLDPFRRLDFGGSAASTLVNLGTITGANGSGIKLSGSVVNMGIMSVESTGSFSDLEVPAGGATLNGGGTITLSGNTSTTRINGLGSPLLTIADQTVQGYGNIGANALSLDLQSGSTVDANANGETLLVDPNSGGMTSSGLMQASNGGTLLLTTGTFDNTDGQILATAGSTVELQGSADISGGSIASNGDGTVEVVAFQQASISDLSLDSDFAINNGSTLLVEGNIDNSGTIQATSESGSVSAIQVESGGATLDGGGTISMAGPTNLTFINGLGNPTLTVEDQTIQGFGGVGLNAISLELQAGNLIDANEDGETLRIDPNGDGMINRGTLQASNGGTLLLTTGTFDNTDGLILATEGSTVELRGGADIAGGSIASIGDGTVEVTPFQQASISDLSLDSDFAINNGSTLLVEGNIDNSGTIQATSESGSVSAIQVESGGATLDGGGTISMAGPTNLTFINGLGNPTLTVEDQTIQGYGNLGRNSVHLDFGDGSVIEANVDGELLWVDPIGDQFVNTNSTGTVGATNGGRLEFNSELRLGPGGEPGMMYVDANSTLYAETVHVGQNTLVYGTGFHFMKHAEFLMGGILSPGEFPTTSISGIMRFVGDLSLSGETRIEIASATEFDRIEVHDHQDIPFPSGQLNAGGRLTISFLDGFVPQNSDSFFVMHNSHFPRPVSPPEAFDNTTNDGRIFTEDGSGSFAIIVDNGYDPLGGDSGGGNVQLYDFQPTIPSAATNLNIVRGVQTAGTVADLATSDNIDVSVRRDQSLIAAVVEVEVASTTTVLNPNVFTFTVESATFNRTEVIQSVEFFDYDAGEFVEIDSRQSSRFLDSVVTSIGDGGLSRFVEDGTGNVKTRVLYTSLIPRQTFAANIDQVFWSID